MTKLCSEVCDALGRNFKKAPNVINMNFKYTQEANSLHLSCHDFVLLKLILHHREILECDSLQVIKSFLREERRTISLQKYFLDISLIFDAVNSSS